MKQSLLMQNMRRLTLQTFNTQDTIDKISQTKYPLIAIPFWGTTALVKLSRLTQAQISLCGDISLIETKKDKIKKKKIKNEDIIEYAKTMHRLAEQALISPTYEQIINIVGGNSVNEKARKELSAAKEKLKNCPLNSERKKLETEINQLTVWIDLLLPEDFLSAIVCYTLSVNETDIKKVIDKILLDSAILAERGHNSPADHVKDFVFTEFNKTDFNKRSWIALGEWREKQQEKKTG